MKPNNRKPFNVLLSDKEYNMLQALSNASGDSKGTELRKALSARYLWQVKKQAVCANGSPCFVPHLHQMNAQPRQEEERNE